MTLTRAARLLGMNPEVLRRHCAAGRVPGAFQFVKGGAWHLPANFAELMHNGGGSAPRTEKEGSQWQSENAAKPGGSTSPAQAARELDKVLGHLTAPPRKNCTTS